MRGSSLARHLSLATVVLAAASFCPTSTAVAGTYDVWSCRGPAGAATTTEAWERSAVDPGTGGLVAPTGVDFDDACAAGGGLSVTLAQNAPIGAPVAGLLTFRPAADTRIASYALWRRLTAGTPPLLVASYLAARTERTGTTGVDSELCATAECVLGDLDSEAPSSLVVRPAATGDAIELRVQVDCLLALCLNALSGMPPRATLHRSRVTLEDTVAPASPQLSGGLADDGAATGRATLVVASEDRGGGIAAVSLAIDGQPWQTVGAGSLAASCRIPYAEPAPCPAEVEQPFEIDTGALSAGDHTASGTILDAAGNATAWGPVGFRVQRPTIAVETRLPAPLTRPPGPSNGSPAVERPRLRLARSLVEAPAGARVRLSGRLATRTGAPIAGARLAISTSQLGLRGDRPPGHRATTTTDAAGRFTIVRRARGAQRLAVGFSPRPEAATTAQATATLRSRLSLTTARSAQRLVKGRRLTLRGRLHGAGPSARGALVQIQAIVNGRWSPVGRARTGPGGAYAWRYRFVHLSRDTTFRFRAVVEHVPGWPWPTVRSRSASVRVEVP